MLDPPFQLGERRKFLFVFIMCHGCRQRSQILVGSGMFPGAEKYPEMYIHEGICLQFPGVPHIILQAFGITTEGRVSINCIGMLIQ